VPDRRRDELLDLAHAYVQEHGLADLSLRPLAAAIGSSPRVLLFLFDSKDGLVRALLARARADELRLLEGLPDQELTASARTVWGWLRDPVNRPLVTLWAEAYTRSLVDKDGPWAGFAEQTVEDWLGFLGESGADRAQCTAVLSALRGALLDLLATGDDERVTAGLHLTLKAWDAEK
jgi:AcrR family transcriptional regulator